MKTMMYWVMGSVILAVVLLVLGLAKLAGPLSSVLMGASVLPLIAAGCFLACGPTHDDDMKRMRDARKALPKNQPKQPKVKKTRKGKKGAGDESAAQTEVAATDIAVPEPEAVAEVETTPLEPAAATT